MRSTEGINNAGRLVSRTDTTMAHNGETIWHNVHSAAKAKHCFCWTQAVSFSIHPVLIQVSITNFTEMNWRDSSNPLNWPIGKPRYPLVTVAPSDKQTELLTMTAAVWKLFPIMFLHSFGHRRPPNWNYIFYGGIYKIFLNKYDG